MRRWITRSLVLVLVAFAGFLIWDLTKPLPALPPLPNPNGYDDLQKAAELVSSNAFDWYQLTKQELLGAVSTNAMALRLARTGLTRPSRVRLKYQVGSNGVVWIENLGIFKGLGQALAAEGRLRELEGRTNEAAASYSDVLRVGHECCRGGPVFYSLVGNSIQVIGTVHLERIAANLDSNTC